MFCSTQVAPSIGFNRRNIEERCNLYTTYMLLGGNPSGGDGMGKCSNMGGGIGVFLKKNFVSFKKGCIFAADLSAQKRIVDALFAVGLRRLTTEKQ